MKKHLLILMSLVVSTTVNATIVQSFHLKDGSVINGYIESQDNEGNMILRGETATICRPDTVASITNSMDYPESNLSQEWIEWAEKNDAFDGPKSRRTLRLSDVSFKDNNHYSKVRILESGKIVKFLDLSAHTYPVKWEDIEQITVDKRKKTELSGVNVTYEMRSGVRSEGQYAGETDSNISLYLPSGEKQTFDYNDVAVQSYKGINPNQDLFEQSPLVDILRMKDKSQVRGIIIEQNYKGRYEDNFYLVNIGNNNTHTVKMSEVVERRRETNPKYNPQFDILLADGEILINRIDSVTYVNVKEKGDFLMLDSVNNHVELKRGVDKDLEIIVEYRNDARMNSEMFQLVKVSERQNPDYNQKKSSISNKKNDTPEKRYGFSYRDLVNGVIRADKFETSINNTSKVVYTVDRPGIYALYDSVKMQAVTIIVK